MAQLKRRPLAEGVADELAKNPAPAPVLPATTAPRRKLKPSLKVLKAKAMKGKIRVINHGW